MKFAYPPRQRGLLMYRYGLLLFTASILLPACGEVDELGRPVIDSAGDSGDADAGEDGEGDGGDDDNGDGDGDGDGDDDDGDSDGDEGGDSGGDGGDGDDGDDDGNDDGDDDGNNASCDPGEWDFDLMSTPASVVLVLDKSGSMMAKWDHDLDSQSPTVTRWNSLYNTVDFIMQGFGTEMNFGAVLFPSKWANLEGQGYENACLMSGEPEVFVGPDKGAEILGAIPGPYDTVAGGTPAREGILNALSTLGNAPENSPRAMILITDGAANCADGEAGYDSIAVFDDGLEEVVEGANVDDGIPTYVIGIDILDEMGNVPAANPHEELSKVANAGGAPKQGDDSFYNVTNEIELNDALSTITGNIECSISLEVEPSIDNWVRVSVNGKDVDQVDDCESEDGWVFTNPNGPWNTITLCGTACQAGDAHIEYVCP